MNLDVGLGKTVNVDGNIVELDALRIVERIKEYDPNLDVICLNPALAGINDAPFILVERCDDGVQRRVFEFWELDARILDRIQMADRDRGVDIHAKVKEINNAVLLGERRRYEEQREETKDLVATLVKVSNKKSSASFKDKITGDHVTVYEDRPATRGLPNGRNHY